MKKINHIINTKSILHLKNRNHCHFTGKYKDAADNICNLIYEIPK